MASFNLLVDRHYAHSFPDLLPTTVLNELGLVSYYIEGSELPENFRSKLLQLGEQGKTCLCVPRREWKAIFFDMDSTVIAEESIVELARAAGKDREVSDITERAMAGELDFVEALRARVAMLKAVPSSVIDKVAKTLTINPGMKAFANVAKSKGVSLYLVSGGFVPLAKKIAEELGFDDFHANQLEVKAGQLTGELEGTIVDAQGKLDFVLSTCQQKGIDLSSVVVVGDGANDLLMMRAAAVAIGYHPKPVLLPHLNGANFSDHSAMIPLLWPRSDETEDQLQDNR